MKNIENLIELGFRRLTDEEQRFYSIKENRMVFQKNSYEFRYIEQNGNPDNAIIECGVFIIDCEDFIAGGYFKIDYPLNIDFRQLTKDLDNVVEKSKNNGYAVPEIINGLEMTLKKYSIRLYY